MFNHHQILMCFTCVHRSANGEKRKERSISIKKVKYMTTHQPIHKNPKSQKISSTI